MTEEKILERPDFHARILAAVGLEAGKNPDLLNPLTLAYLGDTIFDLAVRTSLVNAHDAKPHALHLMSAARVCAGAQAQAAKALLPLLSEDEAAVFRRARNSKPGMIPKNAAPDDYANATGLEALLGWLFLSGREERLLELLQKALEAQSSEEAQKRQVFRPHK